MLLTVCLLLPHVGLAEDKGLLRLYIDADYTGTRASAVAIEQGIRTALSEINYEVNGHAVELVSKNHRGSSARSKRHLDHFLKDDKALAVFCGLHSPPVLAQRDFINEQKILLLDPWAAAGPITRYPSPENMIFRLSIDDSNAGAFIVNHAVSADKFKAPFLLLEKTGWGKGNEKRMREALAEKGLTPAGVEFFNWNIEPSSARIILRNIKNSGADCILLVANAPEGKVFCQALSSLPAEMRLPIRSHWGITGGDFEKVIDKQIRDKIDLVFLQTRFSFVTMGEDPFGNQVLELAKQLFPNEIRTAEDIYAPTGFIHAYDLTRILIAAIQESELSGNIIEDRKRVKVALEHLNTSVKGLIKTYHKPFQEFSDEDPSAHEALDAEDYVMASYGERDEIRILPFYQESK